MGQQEQRGNSHIEEKVTMADDGSFSRSSIICFSLILMLSEVVGIRTGDHISTRRNLFELLNDQGLTKFLDLITKAEIQDAFTGTEEMTVFAFNNTAFDILPIERKTAIGQKNRQQTENFVKFHTVYKQRILTEYLQDNSDLKSNGPNQNILFVNKKRLIDDYDNTEQIFINGARIVKRDISATNGILQIIDRVLEITSNKMAVPYLDDPDDPRVKGKLFYDLIQHSQARDELRNEAMLTLFVPTDKAMERVNKEKLDQQRQNPQALKEIILKHRTNNKVIFTSTVEFGTQWTPNSNIPILYKNTYEQVFVTSGGTTARIVLGNITVGNGVVHMIDNLLGFTYNNVLEQITGDPQLSKFYNLLSKVNIKQIEEAIGTKNKVTVFVPTNEAFERLTAADRNKLQYDSKFIEEIIKNHIVEDFSWKIAPIIVDYNARERQICMLGSYLSVYNFRYERYVHGGYVTAKVVRADVGCTNGIVQYIDRILGVPDENIMSVIHNHPWLKKVPYMAYTLTGLKDSLAGENKPDSYNLCPQGSCFYTVFVPNETAYENMRLIPQSEFLLRDTRTHRYLLERLIIKNEKVYEEKLAIGRKIMTAVNGNTVVLEKYFGYVILRYRGKVTNVLQSDLGATNGVVYIVDRMLWTSDDLEVSTGFSHHAKFMDLIFILTLLISLSTLLHQ